MTIAAGDYEGKAIEGKVQYGETEAGTLQLAIDMEIFNGSKSLGQMTTFLYFTEASAVYAFERLRALGWKGKGAEDIDKLGDIYSTRVPVRITAPEQYRDPGDGTLKTGQAKLEIVTSSTVKIKKFVDESTFKARLGAITGKIAGNGGSGGGGGAPPPF